MLLKVWLYFGLTAIGTLIVGEQMLPLVRADRAARDRGLRVRALPAVAAARPRAPSALVVVTGRHGRARERHGMLAGAIFTGFFVGLAWAWRETRFARSCAVADRSKGRHASPARRRDRRAVIRCTTAQNAAPPFFLAPP